MQAPESAPAGYRPPQTTYWVAGAKLMPHAARRADQRDINGDELYETITNPDQTYPGRANKWVSIKDFDQSGRRIKVVWVMEDGQQIVITVGDQDITPDGRYIWKD